MRGGNEQQWRGRELDARRSTRNRRSGRTVPRKLFERWRIPVTPGTASKTAKTINASIIYTFETKIVPPSKDPSN